MARKSMISKVSQYEGLAYLDFDLASKVAGDDELIQELCPLGSTACPNNKPVSNLHLDETVVSAHLQRNIIRSQWPVLSCPFSHCSPHFRFVFMRSITLFGGHYLIRKPEHYYYKKLTIVLIGLNKKETVR